MRMHLAVVAVLVLAIPPAARAQVRRTDVNLAIGQLDLAVRALPPVAALPRIQAAVSWLGGRAARTDPAKVSQAYVRSLEQIATLLRTDPRAVVADDVAEELEAKVDHCRELGIGMGGSVLLSVDTKRGGQPVRDWQVFYLLKIYEHVKGAAPTVFPGLSSPTQSPVEPGRYWLWARDPATGRTSERALVRVAGRTELQVDLPVP